MSKLRDTTASDLPPRVVPVPPSAFADDWHGRPDSEVAIGLCFVSAEDIDAAMNTALERAESWATNEGRRDEAHFNKVYNEQLIYGIVGRAAVNPNDCTRRWFPAPCEDSIRRAMTPDGARRLWDELQLLHVGSGVQMPMASDDDIRRLAAILARGIAIGAATSAKATEARKFAWYLLEQLGPLDPKATPEDADEITDEDDDTEASDEGYDIRLHE